MKTLSIIKYAVVSGLIIAACGCTSNSGKKAPSDTPTSGTIHIAVDEAFIPAVQSNITAFQGLYLKAKVIPHYVSEKEAFTLLLKDSVRLVVSGRGLTHEEADYFKSITITPKTLKIATDALGVVLNRTNPDSLLDVRQLRKILAQKDFLWNELTGKGLKEKPELVIDKEGTSNYFALLRLLNIQPNEIQVKVTAAGGDREVINYVNQHPAAIGFMGANWISDPEDPTQTRFRQGITVASLLSDSLLRSADSSTYALEDSYFQPLQAYLAQGFYPLTREVFVVSREARAGLGTGFMAWLASDKGQRVILKNGLLPATMPIRIVKLKKDNDFAR